MTRMFCFFFEKNLVVQLTIFGTPIAELWLAEPDGHDMVFVP